MPELQRLRLDHARELFSFERENRSYFAASIPDRGDAFFARFDDRLRALLAEQDDGMGHFHVLVDEDKAVVGRLNLVDVADGTAELGYRIARRAAGRGLATAAVRSACQLARTDYGLRELRAQTTLDNEASLAVLARTGFRPVGDMTLDGRPGRRFLRNLDA
ncbi:ribosomal-protein-S5-alanine N-acetyltransferase [Streptomyces sp. YIM 130001]|uniref:GNAT family N-acetyltransferase n=1 Tax=Streptomyces sp. YIM 130001 TaxID=2259644 RepID=UPI000E65C6E6|nr:GNAT family N-acetyltransferase [Streptomyces sp. YIM 130001]RII14660.1 ribosomal-protein-S5-alanine N-acetyltransferase [Streptomyces sp. YIM 130001]